MEEPEILYHNTKAETLEKILSSKKLRASDASGGNDPFEVRHGGLALSYVIDDLRSTDDCADLHGNLKSRLNAISKHSVTAHLSLLAIPRVISVE